MSTQVRMNYHQKAQAHKLLEEHMSIKERITMPTGEVVEVWKFEEGWSDERIAKEIGLERHNTVTNFRRELGFRTMLPPGAAPPRETNQSKIEELANEVDELGGVIDVAFNRVSDLQKQLEALKFAYERDRNIDRSKLEAIDHRVAGQSARLTDVMKRLNDLEDVKTTPNPQTTWLKGGQS